MPLHLYEIFLLFGDFIYQPQNINHHAYTIGAVAKANKTKAINFCKRLEDVFFRIRAAR